MLIKNLDRRSFLKLAAVAGVGLGTPLAEFLQWRVSSAKAQAKALTAGYSNGTLTQTWCAQGKDAVDYYAKLMNINIDWQDPNPVGTAAQRAIFDTFAANVAKYDFFGVQPEATSTLVEPVQAIIKAGKPVVDIDALIAPLKDQIAMGVLTFLSCDNVVLAEGVAQALAAAIGGKGKVARIAGYHGQSASQGRGQGFHNVFDPLVKSGTVTIVEEQENTYWDADVAAGLTKTLLTKYSDLGAIFYDNDDMALAGLKVVTDMGKKVALGGIDAMPPAIQAIVAGTYAATARNSANRVHAWSVVAGAWAATVGMDKAKGQIPNWILVDGPVITPTAPMDPKLADTPWLVKGLGIGAAPGQLWLEDNHLL